MKLYIIRGLPGTGKSTLAADLNCCICEADNYFLTDEGYNFDPTKLGEAHQQCFELCKMLMETGTSRIAVSNTSSRHWEYAPYLALAMEMGYQVVEITLTGEIFNNTHNVPNDTIEAMKQRWER